MVMHKNLPILEELGLVHNIYEYLWTKNNLLQSLYRFHQCPPVFLPDTFILRNKFPIAHYHSFKDGTINQRTTDLSLQIVTEALCRYDETDVASVFVGKGPGNISSTHLSTKCFFDSIKSTFYRR
jgi:hypothetical protein